MTVTVVGWIDVFTKGEYKFILVDSLEYCKKHKGLSIFGYCIMSSHLHIIGRADGRSPLSDILRDFKKFTSNAIFKQILEGTDSRKDWMLYYFFETGISSGNKNFKVWLDGNHLEIISSNKFFDEKLDHIHNNPVKEFIVERPDDYLFSSARNYAGLSNYLEIELETVKMRTYK